MKERAHLLGPRKTILAFVHEPEPAPPEARPTFVILNAGIVHRVGPHRASVRLARALAEGGFRAVRFDFSGLGDSPARPDALGYKEATFMDITEVFDDLAARYGATSFVAGGLCAGADRAFEASVRDPRIAGAFLLDGIVYRTPTFYLYDYRHRLGRLTGPAALRAAKRGVTLLRQRLRPAREQAAPGPIPLDREIPAREVFEQQMQQILDRGVHMLWLFTAGLPNFHNYERQFFDSFRRVDFKGRLTHLYFGDSNHTFTQLEAQRRLARHLVAWASDTFR